MRRAFAVVRPQATLIARVLFLLLLLLMIHVFRMDAVQQTPANLSGYDLSNPKLISQGQTIFAQNCAVGYCHGSAGRAGRGPRLRGREWDKGYLFKVTLQGIPNSSMPAWKDKLSEPEVASVVAYILALSKLTSDAQEIPSTSLSASPAQQHGITKPEAHSPGTPASLVAEKNGIIGDPEKGKLLFFDISNELNCGVCHKIRGLGNDVGPDLGNQKTRSARQIARDILLPSASVSPVRKPVSITTRSGESISGVLVEKNSSSLRIYDMGSLPPVLRTIPLDQVLGEKPEDRSPMPEKYEELYTARQLLDLVAFIKDADPKTSPVTLSDLF